MTRDEQFAFNLEDKVTLEEIKRPGKVEAAMIDSLGQSFRVVYWDNGDRKTVWVRPDELSLRS